MKKSIKRILSLLMSCAMAASMLGTVAFADESAIIPSDDSYILSYDDGSKPLLYATDLDVRHTGEGWSHIYTHDSAVFNLVNSRTNESIAAYCTDVENGTESSAKYRRINLEDSTYHLPGSADKLRSVISNTFPHISVNEVAAVANAANYPVKDLTESEIISATQQAIWKITHGDAYTIKEHYASAGSVEHSEEKIVYPSGWLEGRYHRGENEKIATNIKNLYNYFMNLPGTPAEEIAISDAAFKTWDISFEEVAGIEGEASTYTATIKTTVAASVNAKTNLTLTAVIGGKTATADVQNGSHVYTLTISGLTEAGVAKLYIDGEQQISGVYMFDAEGDRTSSQTLIGYDSSTLPVYAEVTIDGTKSQERVLHINKYTPTKTEDTAGDGTMTDVVDRKPVPNVDFSIYKVCTLEDYLNGTVKLNSVPSAADRTTYEIPDNYVATVTTNANGYASYNFGTGEHDGIYLIVEESSSAIVAAADPFFLAVPMTNPDGSGWMYDVYVYPKNDLEDGPDIDKDVTSIDQDEDTFEMNELITYILRGDIPAGLDEAKLYSITDTLDSKLDYEGNVSVKLFAGKAADGEGNVETVELELTKDTHYTVTESAKGTAGGSLKVDLTKAGMQYIVEALKDYDTKLTIPEIRVYFNASINETAILDVVILNDATLEYTNSVNFDYEKESEEVKVYTGGANILKVDGREVVKDETTGAIVEVKETAPLAGATFKVARATAEDETADDTLTIGGKDVGVKYIDFYANGNRDKKVSEITTGSDGKLSIEGLAYSTKETYYLVETKAPAGYNILLEPVVLTIAKGTCAENAVSLYVENYSGFELPETGGIGTTIYTAMGTLMICAAGAYIILSKKRVVC